MPVAPITEKPKEGFKRRMRAQFRALPDLGEGKFEALVSAYDVEYSVGWGWSEKIAQGAFADSITACGGVVPVFYEHEWGVAPVGDAIASETKTGLIVRGSLYIDSDPFVQRIWQALSANALREYSIAFFPTAIEYDPDNDMLDVITKGELIEASICVRGANPGTETLDLRSQPVWIDGDDGAEVARLRSSRYRIITRPGKDWVMGTDRTSDVLSRSWFRDLLREQFATVCPGRLVVGSDSPRCG